MGLFSSIVSPVKAASNAVATGNTTDGTDAGDWKSTLMSLWSSYGTIVMIVAGAFLAWKYLLPMLGLRKKRGGARYLAKARRAKAAKRSKM